MFRGFNTVSIDSKGRMAIPSRFRERLAGTAGGALVLTLNPLDHCLWMYPYSDWELIENKLAELSDFDKPPHQTDDARLCQRLPAGFPG